MEALFRVYALHAEQDETVGAFRERYQPGGRVASSDLEAWIKERAKEDGPTLPLYEAPIPPGTRATHANDGTVSFEPPLTDPVMVNLCSRLLAYPKDGVAHHVPVTAGGAHDSLLDLVQSLARRYGWQEGQATAFVLTGAVPLLDAIRGGASESWPWGARRVKLDVEPRESPRAVAGAFAKARRRFIGQRARDLTPKHLRLAVFLAEAPDSEAWPARMDRWNAEVASERPPWRYTRPNNFERDTTQALGRLLGERRGSKPKAAPMPPSPSAMAQ